MKFAVFSDIHSNLTALKACCEHFCSLSINAKIVILGDYIDYGARPNETITFIKEMSPYLVINGNHEKGLSGSEDVYFSSQRVVAASKLTRKLLNIDSWNFVKKHNYAKYEKICDGKNILFVHGDLYDEYWGRMPYYEMERNIYSKYDFVISGHTHTPHFVEMFYLSDDAARRNRKKTCFINPGSVGQPRNHCKYAQYAVFDTETEEVHFFKANYDIALEQSFFTDESDVFYKERLSLGI
jgi:putative phosphoesterase